MLVFISIRVIVITVFHYTKSITKAMTETVNVDISNDSPS